MVFAVIADCEDRGQRYVIFDTAPSKIKRIILDGVSEIMPDKIMLGVKSILASVSDEYIDKLNVNKISKMLSFDFDEELADMEGKFTDAEIKQFTDCFKERELYGTRNLICIEILPKGHIKQICAYAAECAMREKNYQQ